MAHSTVPPSQEAIDAQEKLKELNKKQREDHASFLKAAQIRQEHIIEKKLENSGYRGKVEQRDFADQQYREQLMKQWYEQLEELSSPSAASYVEWKTGMMKIVAACTTMNNILYSHNLTFTDALFYLKNFSDATTSAGLKSMKTARRIREFFGRTGTLPDPTKFDPKFSMYAKMENGKVYGQLFSGEEAEEVYFTKSGTELAPPDVFLDSYLKAYTDYELITDPMSPMYRQVMKKDPVPEGVYDYLVNNPEAVKQITIAPLSDDDKPDNWDNYQVRAIGFKKDPESEDRYVIVAQEQYLNTDTNTVETREVMIPVGTDASQLGVQDGTDPYHFSGQENSRVDENARIFKLKLPAEAVTSQEQLDEIINNPDNDLSFHDFCQRQINEKVTDYHAKVKMVADENGNYGFEYYKVINGKETKVEESVVDIDTRNSIKNLFEAMIPSTLDPVTEEPYFALADDDSKVVFNNRFQMPNNDVIMPRIESKIRNVMTEEFAPENGIYAGIEIDMKKKEAYFLDSEGNRQQTVKFTLSQTEEDEDRLKVTFNSVPLSGEEVEIDKEQRVLNAKELEAEFGPRLTLALENQTKPFLQELNDTPLELISYNPDAAPAPSSLRV